jgi:hypothetical protein
MILFFTACLFTVFKYIVKIQLKNAFYLKVALRLWLVNVRGVAELMNISDKRQNIRQ